MLPDRSTRNDAQWFDPTLGGILEKEGKKETMEEFFIYRHGRRLL
jgi:hypothetical protein